MNTSKRKGALQKTSHHALSRVGLLVMGALITGSFFFTAFLASPGLLSNQLAAVVTSLLVTLTNQDRSGSGLGTLTVNPQLIAAAQAKANDMAAKGYFAHVSPDGRNSWAWFKDAGYSFSYAGENLAVDFTDSGDVNQAWLNSPTHRANILNSHFTEIGIATAEGQFEGHKTTFVVQMFGRPATSPQTVVSATLPQNAKEPAMAHAEPSNTVLGSSVGPAKSVPAKVQPIAVAPNQKALTAVGQPATVATSGVQKASAPQVPSLFGAPRELLRDFYIFFALILIFALGVRTRFEFKLHHMRHALAVVVLMVMMGSFLIAADHFIFLPPIIGQGVSN